MSPETKKRTKNLMVQLKDNLDFLKTCDVDQFTVQRFSLIYVLADQIDKHLEV